MYKRVLVLVLTIVMILPLCGCWNYRGLDQMDIVVGIAIDFDKEADKYNMTFEVVDLTEDSKDRNIKGKLVEAEGKTLFDAVRNAKRLEADRLFFGSSYIVIVSQEVARDIGLSPVLEWFLRDGECRETMFVTISQENTAKAILENRDETSVILSVIIQDIIKEDSQVTASSMDLRLYEVFSMLQSQRDSVMLSALRNVQEGDKKSCQLDGIAVCKGDRLVGFISPEESKYALFVEDKLKGGILTLSMAGMQTDDISLEVFGNHTKRSFTYEQGKVKILIETDTEVSIAENQSRLDTQDEQLIKSIEDAAAQMIEKNIAALIAKLQNEFHADTFGFGEMIYKRDLPLWKQLEGSWDQMFPTVEVEVSSRVQVKYSGFLS